jgi:hypothetical protein
MNLIAMFHNSSLKVINFEDMQEVILNPQKNIIINVLPTDQQECLIPNTLPIHLEEKTINDIVQACDTVNKTIVIYGKNCGDYSILEKKNKQFIALGFFNVFVYLGGLFEWVLLQDIYGAENFPTSKRILDIIQFRPSRNIISR